MSFKKRYIILWQPGREKLERAVYLEMNAEGWVPLGAAFYIPDSDDMSETGWYQTLWLPEDPHTTGLVKGKSEPQLEAGEEILMEVDGPHRLVDKVSSVNFVGKPPEGDYSKED